MSNYQTESLRTTNSDKNINWSLNEGDDDVIFLVMYNKDDNKGRRGGGGGRGRERELELENFILQGL